jgi:hypothetical protein
MTRVLILEDGRGMARALVAALLALGVSACAREIRTEPVAAQCEAMCFVPCTTEAIRWTANADGAEAWDALGDQVIQPLSQRVTECSRTHRRACHLCLWRLQEQKVVTGIPPVPEEEEPP